MDLIDPPTSAANWVRRKAWYEVSWKLSDFLGLCWSFACRFDENKKFPHFILILTSSVICRRLQEPGGSDFYQFDSVQLTIEVTYRGIFTYRGFKSTLNVIKVIRLSPAHKHKHNLTHIFTALRAITIHWSMKHNFLMKRRSQFK